MKKVAIIGTGNIAETVHAPYYQTRSDDLDLAAVFDIDLARAQAFAKKHTFQRAYNNLEELFREVKPDIVSVCTPNAAHYGTVLTALEHGADVICEKPPAMSYAEASEMAQVAKERGKILAYDFQYRFSDEGQFLLQKKAVLGDLYLADAIAERRSGVPGWGNFISKERQGGGPLIDIGVHVLDLALAIFDFAKVDRISAAAFSGIGTSRNKGTLGTWDPNKYDVEDSLFGTIYLKTGQVVRLSTSFLLNTPEAENMNLLLYGKEAGANLRRGTIITDVDGELKTVETFNGKRENAHVRSLRAFVDATIDRDTHNLATAEQGAYDQLVVDSLYASAEQRRDIKFP